MISITCYKTIILLFLYRAQLLLTYIYNTDRFQFMLTTYTCHFSCSGTSHENIINLIIFQKSFSLSIYLYLSVFLILGMDNITFGNKNDTRSGWKWKWIKFCFFFTFIIQVVNNVIYFRWFFPENHLNVYKI